MGISQVMPTQDRCIPVAGTWSLYETIAAGIASPWAGKT